MKLTAILLAATIASPAAAADASIGRTTAQACAVCHGPIGVSSAPDAPHLAGQPQIYLAATTARLSQRQSPTRPDGGDSQTSH